MNTFFIIGGIIVLAGICAMTYLYYQTAAELKEKEDKLSEVERVANEYLDLLASLDNYEIASPEDVQDLKFGDF